MFVDQRQARPRSSNSVGSELEAEGDNGEAAEAIPVWVTVVATLLALLSYV